MGELVHSKVKSQQTGQGNFVTANGIVDSGFISKQADLTCVAHKQGEWAERNPSSSTMAGSLGLRTAFGGQRVQSMAQRAKLAQAPVVHGAAVTQRLKPGKPPGTQRLTPKQAPSLPSGTQVKKKVGQSGLAPSEVL